MTGLKDCKSCQKNVSLSLSKRKLDEKTEWKFSNHQMRSCMLSHTSQIAGKASFVSIALFRV